MVRNTAEEFNSYQTHAKTEIVHFCIWLTFLPFNNNNDNNNCQHHYHHAHPRTKMHTRNKTVFIIGNNSMNSMTYAISLLLNTPNAQCLTSVVIQSIESPVLHIKQHLCRTMAAQQMTFIVIQPTLSSISLQQQYPNH